jgi:hypothetical protein
MEWVVVGIETWGDGMGAEVGGIMSLLGWLEDLISSVGNQLHIKRSVDPRSTHSNRIHLRIPTRIHLLRGYEHEEAAFAW